MAVSSKSSLFIKEFEKEMRSTGQLENEQSFEGDEDMIYNFVAGDQDVSSFNLNAV